MAEHPPLQHCLWCLRICDGMLWLLLAAGQTAAAGIGGQHLLQLLLPLLAASTRGLLVLQEQREGCCLLAWIQRLQQLSGVVQPL
jgi:hypothetical protein